MRKILEFRKAPFQSRRSRLVIPAAAILMSLSANFASAQNSIFKFDAPGDLLSQASETSGFPQITGQPQNQVVIPGQSTSYSVVVADTQGISYQWYLNGSAIPGATDDAYLLTNVSTNDAGQYSVIVSNIAGPTLSSPAYLYIDSDGDGLPDSWEIAHFGNLNQTASGDFDGDGVSNLQEYLDGTDPTNAASALYRITLVNDGGTVVAVPDQPTYSVGQKVILTATGSAAFPFHAWTGDVVTRSNSITLTMTNNVSLTAHFIPFTLVWTNTIAGDWNAGSNWRPNLAPGSNESVVILNPVTVTLNSNVDLVDLTLGSGTQGPELTGTGRITISGTGSWSAGIMSGTGATIVLPGASFTIADPVTAVNLNGRTLENRGMAIWSSGGIIGISGGVITNDAGAIFQIPNPGSFNYEGGLPRFDNAGTLLSATNGTTAFSGVAFNNYGETDIRGGTLSIAGGGVDTGTMTVPAGTTINFGGGVFTSSIGSSITGAGTFMVSGGNSTLAGTVQVTGTNIFNNGTIDFTGSYICTNNTMLISGATANFDGTGVVAPAVLNLNGFLGGSSVVTVTGAMNWTAGSMSGSGRTVIPAGVTLNIANPTVINLISRTLDNSGTVLWTGGTMGVNSAVITNEPGALFQIQNPATFSYGGGSPRFDNAGTLRISGAGTTFFASVSFNNYNDTQIQSGTLQTRRWPEQRHDGSPDRNNDQFFGRLYLKRRFLRDGRGGVNRKRGSVNAGGDGQRDRHQHLQQRVR